MFIASETTQTSARFGRADNQLVLFGQLNCPLVRTAKIVRRALDYKHFTTTW